MFQTEINVRRFGALATGPCAFLCESDRSQASFPMIAFHALMTWYEEYGRFLPEEDWARLNRWYGLRRPTGPGRHLTAWMLQIIFGNPAEAE